MRDRRLLWGGGFLALLAILALGAPWLGLRDPTRQPDTLVLRELPPLSRAEAILKSDGTLQYAHEIQPQPDGSVLYRRGQTWSRMSPEELRGGSSGEWHRRPMFALGTDGFGRDLLSRMIHGARVSLLVGLIAALIAVCVGATVGLVSGLAGGWMDALLMRFTDLVLSVPRLFLALMLVALYDRSLTTTRTAVSGR